CLDVRRDINDEGRAHVRIEGSIENLVRAVGSAVFWREIQLRKPGGEAGLIAKCCSRVVVRMPALPIRQDHDTGTKAAKHGGDLQPVFAGVLNIAVGEVE